MEIRAELREPTSHEQSVKQNSVTTLNRKHLEHIMTSGIFYLILFLANLQFVHVRVFVYQLNI